MRLLLYLFRGSRWAAVASICFGLLSGGASALLIALINYALGLANSATTVLVWGFAALCLGKIMTGFIAEVALIRLAQRAVFDLRMHLCRRILATPLRLIEEAGEHRLTAALVEDVPVIAIGLTTVSPLCVNLAVTLGCLIYIGWLSYLTLVAVMVFMLIGVASYQIPIVRARKRFKLARDEQDTLYKFFRTLTAGIKELKLRPYRSHAFLNDELQPTAQILQRHTIAGLSIFAGAGKWGNALFLICIALLIFAVPAFKTVEPQELTGYTLAILYLMAPLEAILNYFPALGRAQVAMNKIESLGMSLAAQPGEVYQSVSSARPKRWERLELDGVAHQYHHEQYDNSFRLGPIDLKFNPGELVFIVGGNGSGKTTLVKLLTGLYLPEAGEIRLDGERIMDENRARYRQLFSVVFSDFHLFDHMLGLEDAQSETRAREYLRRLQLDHKVQINDGRFSTVDLSQGQRKRLALLTTYLEDRPIYVFDEWAADQDPYFKKIFYSQLLPELKARGKTVIVISHDDHYYDVADRFIKLNYGQVEEDRRAESLAHLSSYESLD
jgi:putative pyoverdin transport system ATP-binding/permease protein